MNSLPFSARSVAIPPDVRQQRFVVGVLLCEGAARGGLGAGQFGRYGQGGHMFSTGKVSRGLAGLTALVAVALLGTSAAMAEDKAEVKADVKAEAKAGGKQMTYSGTFTESNKRTGPLECQMTEGQGGNWAMRFNGKQEGTGGPKRSAEFTFDLPGKKEGDVMTLTGNPSIGRLGTYELTMTVTAQTAEGKFSNAKSNGTFALKAQAAKAP
jgi:hypothetical protein